MPQCPVTPRILGTTLIWEDYFMPLKEDMVEAKIPPADKQEGIHWLKLSRKTSRWELIDLVPFSLSK